MAKLNSKRFGPFQITASAEHAAYRLDIPSSWKHKGKYDVFYEAHLSPHHGLLFNSTIAKPKIIDGKEVYEVECILDSKKVEQSIHYLIK